MAADNRTKMVLQMARECGFARVGVAAAGPVPRMAYVRSWLQAGRAGEMAYLDRHRDLLADPRTLLASARSIIVVADSYAPPPGTSATRQPSGEPRGRVARYAWGRDYHRVLRRKLHRLADRLHACIPAPFETRVCVDTAPLLEREWGSMAGIGWIGKNTMVLHQEIGSFFFLGEILTTLELDPSRPALEHCGTCTRCLEACPTGALTAPHQMDARLCISYLTIEHRTEIAPHLRPLLGDWVYGCDICQEVCPYNHRAPAASEPAYHPTGMNPLVPDGPLSVLQNWQAEDYNRCLAGSAMRRATLPMLQRNAAIVAGNLQNGQAADSTPAGRRIGPPDPEPAA
jgi:epoxyqueuosine reductase